MKNCDLLLTGSHRILKIFKQMLVEKVGKKGVVFWGVFDKIIQLNKVDRHNYSYYL
jgi:hypothetical protein